MALHAFQTVCPLAQSGQSVGAQAAVVCPAGPSKHRIAAASYGGRLLDTQRATALFGANIHTKPTFGTPIRVARHESVAPYQGAERADAARCEAPRPPTNSYAVARTATFTADESTDNVAPPPNREVTLRQLVALLLLAQNDADRVSILEAQPAVRGFLARARRQAVRDFPRMVGLKEKLIFYSIIAIGQGPRMLVGTHRLRRQELLRRLGALVEALEPVQSFYSDIGGVAGYHLKVLDLIAAHEGGVSHGGEDLAACPVQHGEEAAAAAALLSSSASGGLLGQTSSSTSAGVEERIRFDAPPLVDLRGDDAAARLSPAWGIEHLPDICELYPLGGAGDRLGLVDPVTGASLPAACLPMQGRSMLEIMVRDLTGREYLYYKCYGDVPPTPVAIMTSMEKDNHAHVTRLCEENGFFGRPRDSFFFFTQPSVPAVTKDGKWLFRGPVQLVTKPGGHGVVWRLAQQAGLFRWLAKRGRTKALVRQINNPIAGNDTLLLSLAGVGCRLGKSFGFAATERARGASEGVNVLVERRVVDEQAGSARHEYAVTNVEYTDFAKHGMADDAENLDLPSNANLLFVDLEAVQEVLRRPGAGHPGLTVNLSKPLKYADERGAPKEAAACRLESTMQSVADYLTAETAEALEAGPERDGLVPTFVLFDERRRVTSSAKKKFAPERGAVMQTPERSFYDSLRNARELLAARCGLELPEVPPFDEYVAGGLRPPFLAWYHPALGPTFEVIAQKVRGGRLAPGAELRLEIAELDAEGLEVAGSLRVEAEHVVGAPERPGGPVRMDDARAGRCTLRRVRVANAGVRYEAPDSCFWQARVSRAEGARIVIRGNGEFHAEDVTLAGDVTYEVPAGCRMVVSAGPGGQPVARLEPLAGGPTWRWGYWVQSGAVRLAREERGRPAAAAAEELRAAAAAAVGRARGLRQSIGLELSLASAAL